MHWLVEHGVFASGFDLTQAARRAHHRVTRWEDDWWTTQSWPRSGGALVFHGSLGNAARIRRDHPSWHPGSYCDVGAFHCSSWYERARPWLLNETWSVVGAEQLVAAPPSYDPLFVLRGERVTHAARWEDDYWELMGAIVPDVTDARRVPLSILIDSDPSLAPVASLAVGEAVCRDDARSPWRPWVSTKN